MGFGRIAPLQRVTIIHAFINMYALISSFIVKAWLKGFIVCRLKLLELYASGRVAVYSSVNSILECVKLIKMA